MVILVIVSLSALSAASCMFVISFVRAARSKFAAKLAIFELQNAKNGDFGPFFLKAKFWKP